MLVKKLKLYNNVNIQLRWFKSTQISAHTCKQLRVNCLILATYEQELLRDHRLFSAFVLLMNVGFLDDIKTCRTQSILMKLYFLCSSKRLHDIETDLTKELELIHCWLIEKSLFQLGGEYVLFGSRPKLYSIPTL